MNVHTDPRRAEDGLTPVRPSPQGAPEQPETLDLARLFRGALRQSWLVAGFAFAGGVAAIAYAVSLTPLYTSYATIYLDEERAELLDLVSEVPGAALRDASVESELEVMKSNELALRVVDRVDLLERPEALAVEKTPIEVVTGHVEDLARGAIEFIVGEEETEATAAGAADAAEPDPRDAVADALRQNFDVFRVGRSYVLQIAYTAPDPVLAREIAAAYAEAYVEFQRDANSEAVDAAVEWLQRRVRDLREDYLEVSRELAEFRAENGLVSVGGRLLSEQQLSEILTQLVTAQADVARARAVVGQAEDAVEEGPSAALAVLMTLEGSETLAADLNARLATARRQRTEILDRFGEGHPEAQRLAREIELTSELIVDELRRRAAGARNALRAAESRVDSLKAGLEGVLDASTADSSALYRLRQLEQTETSYEELYRAALMRLERVNQQGSVPIVAARVITAPDVPKGASEPSKVKYGALGVLLGAFLGGSIGLLREARRNPLSNREDVQRYLGADLVATLPRLDRRRSISASRRGVNGTHATHNDPRLPQTLRAVKLALDRATAPAAGARTIGFISAMPGEGKTLIAVNFAAMLARHGYATLLVDADPSGWSVTRHFKAKRGRDLVGLVRDDAEPGEDDLERVGVAPLFLLPLGREEDPWSALTFASAGRIGRVFDALRRNFDYIVLDLPATSEATDSAVFATELGGVVVVNRTSQAGLGEVREVIDDPSWENKLLGVLLNRG